MIKTPFYSQYRELEAELEQYDVVTFDVFDTLIKRMVFEPRDVFRIVEKRFFSRYKERISSFWEDRITAEKMATKKYSNPSLEQIYEFLEEKKYHSKEQLIQIELEVENKICIPNESIVKIFHRCIELGKKVFLVSDMYLSGIEIEKILLKCGIYGYQRIYVSNEKGASKSKGDLYRLLVDSEKIESCKILHIGDSFIGDYLRPKLIGISSRLIQREIDSRLIKPWTRDKQIDKELKRDSDYSLIYNFSFYSMPADYDEYQEIGYMVLGPLLYGYSLWLMDRFEKDDRKPFFLSREGKLLQKAFNIVCDVPSEYLMVSRQAVTFALCDNAKCFEDLLCLIQKMPNCTLGELLRLCGMDDAEFCDERINCDISNFDEDKREQIFKRIAKNVHDSAESQNALLRKYLNDMNFNGKVAVCDVGWLGTIQSKLSQIVPNIDIEGLYFGSKTDVRYPEYKRLTRQGFLFDSDNLELQYKLNVSTSIFEILFLATEGSVCGYCKDQDSIFPRLEKPENDKDNRIIIEKIQTAGLAYVQKIKSVGIEDYFDNSSLSACANYLSMTLYPTSKILTLFSRFKFSDANGIHSLIPEHSFWRYYIFNFPEFRKDMMCCSCKNFFLKKIFSIDLPYYKLVIMMKRIRQG